MLEQLAIAHHKMIINVPTGQSELLITPNGLMVIQYSLFRYILATSSVVQKGQVSGFKVEGQVFA